MFRNFKKNDVNDSEVISYVVDKKEQQKLNIYFRTVSDKISFFGKILYKLGFDTEKVLYLKRDEFEDNLVYYYSYEDGNFVGYNRISL